MIRRLLYIILIVPLFVCSSDSDEPILLNDNWYFIPDRESRGIEDEYFSKDFNIDELQPVIVPQTWESHTPENYDGQGWYFTNFEYDGRFSKVALRVSSVDDNAIIWLNEKKVGEHYGANSEFKLNLTPHILKGENRLAILVEDT
ncbi:hypothetical protein GF337_03625, partial [candidate division KSB1 bacterium]|nr:hypothetical protein [candidate division KSB1 bacterium]